MAFKFPDFMNGSQDGELQDMYGALPGMFDTSGIEQNVGQQQQMNVARGLRGGEAMTRAAQSRAGRNGGQVAASFAAGGAMLPIYAQNAAMTGDLARIKLQNAQQLAAQRTQLAQSLAQGRQQNLALRTGFYGDTLARKQQESQFGRQLTQQGSQFDRNLSQQDEQFGQQMGYQNRALGQNASQFQQTFGLQRDNTAFQRAMAAYNMIPSGPAYTMGPNQTTYDIQAQNQANMNQMQRRALQSRIQSLI